MDITLNISNREQKLMAIWTGNRSAWVFSKAGKALITCRQLSMMSGRRKI